MDFIQFKKKKQLLYTYLKNLLASAYLEIRLLSMSVIC